MFVSPEQVNSACRLSNDCRMLNYQVESYNHFKYSLIFSPKTTDYLEFDTMMSVITLNVYDTE